MNTELATQGLSLNPVSDLNELFSYHFMVNALEAGTLVAITASAIGWFMVVRRQTFAGHTLSLIAFPGAAAAALVGAPPFVGYFAACATGSLALSAATGGEARSLSQESAAIGSVQAFALGCGFLFVSLYHGLLNGLDSLLFGTFLGISDAQVRVLIAVAIAVAAVLAAIARPLLFASVDADVARASGVPVRALSVGFLLLLGLAVAATSQITGALLVFALLVTPAAAAQLITTRPGLSLALSLAIALAVTWLGLGVAYFSIYPVGFFVTSFSFGLYVLARIWRALADRQRTFRGEAVTR
jgi:zinc/manganese transport system permease protein